MTLETAVSLLGTENPWHAVNKEDFALHFFGDTDDEWPSFAMNRLETIQFRVIGGTIDAVILRPEEVDNYDSLLDQLAEHGFGFERKNKINVEGGGARFEASYTNENVRVMIPENPSAKPGFGCAISIEMIR